MYNLVKRVLDISISLIAIILTSPIWIITIIGIEISDFGPVFYKANRIGRDNKEFTMFKFRSMYLPKESNKTNEASLRPESDRIFLWGRIIRKLKMDELPQFINVLIGSMSVVGPRPVAKDQMHLFRFDKYDEAKKVNPGITGPAALYDYVYGDEFEDSNIEDYMRLVYPTRRELEYVYVQKKSFSFDLWIFFETVLCVLYSLFGAKNVRLLNKLTNMAHDSNPDLSAR